MFSPLTITVISIRVGVLIGLSTLSDFRLAKIIITITGGSYANRFYDVFVSWSSSIETYKNDYLG